MIMFGVDPLKLNQNLDFKIDRQKANKIFSEKVEVQVNVADFL